MSFLEKNLHHLKQISPDTYKAVKACGMKGYKRLKGSDFKDYERQNINKYRMLVIPGLGNGDMFEFIKKLGTNNIDVMIVIEKNPAYIKDFLTRADVSQLISFRKLYFICDTDNLYSATYNLIFGDPKIKYYLKSYSFFLSNKAVGTDPKYYVEAMKKFIEAAQQSLENFGNSPRDAYQGLENMMDNIKYTFQHPGLINIKDQFKKHAGVVVAAGPSLNKNMHLLKDLRNRAIIICVDTAYKTLIDNGIYPHIVTGIERTPTVINYFCDLEGREDELGMTIFAPATVYQKSIYEKCVDEYGMKTMIVYRDFAHYKWLGKDKGTIASGKSGANLAFNMLKYIGCSTILLVGQDLAFAPDGSTHAKGKGADWSSKGMTTTGKIKQRLRVKGNEVDSIETTKVWYGFLKMYENDIMTYKGRVINCTEGGAYIKGAEYMPLQKAIDMLCPADHQIWEKLNKAIDIPIDFDGDYGRFKAIAEETKDFLNWIINIDCENETIEAMDKLKNEIIHHKLFYLFMMHIIQSYFIMNEIELNKILCDLFGDREEQEKQLMINYKKWFETMRSISEKSIEYINRGLK